MFSVSSINKHYGKNQVLTDISFSVAPGQCIALLGINGSGKSTLLNILARNLRADSGSFGFDIPARTALLPQDNPLLPELSALDNIRLWYPGSKKTVMNEHNMNICRKLGVDSFLNKRVSRLSGGMKKRLSLAITMMSDPDLLLLDEPLASLDLLCKAGILKYLQEYTSDGGSVIIATHEASALDICNQIYSLRNGHLQLAVDRTKNNTNSNDNIHDNIHAHKGETCFTDSYEQILRE